MIETTAQPGSADLPVAHARPGPSTLCSLLTIAAGVPLALVLLFARLNLALPQVVAELRLSPGQASRALLLIGVGACLAGPLCGWLARALPPWVVLLAALLAIAVAYWRAQHVSTLHGLYFVLTLQGAGAGGLLAGTAALVGAASALTRPYLAGVWAAALVGAGLLAPRLGLPDPASAPGWRDTLEPYPWLLVTASLCTLLLAVVSVADRRPRLFPRWIDLAALLPLVAGGAVALMAWKLPAGRAGTDAGLLVGVLAGGLAGIAAVAPWLSRGGQPGLQGSEPTSASRGAVGSATAAVTWVSAGALGGTLTGLIGIRAFSAQVGSLAPRAALTDLMAVAAAIGVLAGIAGALLPEVYRRTAILVGLLAAAAGAVTLLPATYHTGASMPGFILLAGGCGLALGAVLRSVGPLATAVAGALAAVAIPTTDFARGALVGWRAAAAGGGTMPQDTAGVSAVLRQAEVSAQRWWLVLLVVLLLGAAAVVALAVRRPRPYPGG